MELQVGQLVNNFRAIQSERNISSDIVNPRGQCKFVNPPWETNTLLLQDPKFPLLNVIKPIKSSKSHTLLLPLKLTNPEILMLPIQIGKKRFSDVFCDLRVCINITFLSISQKLKLKVHDPLIPIV